MSELERTRWRVVGVLAFVALACGAWFWTLERILDAGAGVARAPLAAIDRLSDAADRFFTGDVTTRFLSSVTRLHGSRSGRLELATLETHEVLTRTDERRALWDWVSLGATTAEVRAPVVWRYVVPMDGPWNATIDDGILRLVAPPLEPVLPPAIRTDRLERRVDADWLRFDGAERLAELEREFLPTLVARARDGGHLELARERARKTLQEFASSWIVGEGGSAATVRAFEIRFADEAPRDDRHAPRVAGDDRLRP